MAVEVDDTGEAVVGIAVVVEVILCVAFVVSGVDVVILRLSSNSVL